MELSFGKGALLLLLVAAVVAMLTRRLRLPYSAGLVLAGMGLAFLPLAPKDRLHPRNPVRCAAAAAALRSRAFAALGRTAAPVAGGAHAGERGRGAIGSGDRGRNALPGRVAMAGRAGVRSADRRHRPGFGDRHFSRGRGTGASAVADRVGEPVQRRHGGGGVRRRRDAGGGAEPLGLGGGGDACSRPSAAALVCGAATGILALLLAGRTEDHLVELTVTTVAAYGSFLLAEHLHFSGVVAAIAAGLLMGNLTPASEGCRTVDARPCWRSGSMPPSPPIRWCSC